MPLILILDTATKNCSVALTENGSVLESIDYNTGGFSHAEKLHLFIEEVCHKANKTLNDLDAVAISKGPGSYTGLRIGVSAAKGLCYGLDIPLISLETLEILARTYSIKNQVQQNDLLIPMLDARRMEVYTAIFSSKFEKLKGTNALILDESSFDKELSEFNCHFFGDGAEKSETLFKRENSTFTSNIFPESKAMASVAHQKFSNEDFEDVAYFEPYYLKDFVDGKKS
jgi:tRNA threonylcarbamoyladenosine biosynthesis protein TsaB